MLPRFAQSAAAIKLAIIFGPVISALDDLNMTMNISKNLIALIVPLVGVLLLALLFRPLLKDVFLYAPQEGDIVFQSLPPNELVAAISGITNSPFSHCGLIQKVNDEWMVIESLGDVHYTNLNQWMRRGAGAGVVVYRCAMNSDETVRVMKSASAMLGKKYDLRYDFDDEKIYCSELVYKAFDRGIGVKLGKIDKLGDLNWQPYEKTIVKFENGPAPLAREMITPVAITRDGRLVKVFDSF